MYDQLALSPVFMLRISAKVACWLTGAFAATVLALAMLIHRNILTSVTPKSRVKHYQASARHKP